ncbi:MAG: TIGR03435 family protein [Acidobacteriaceae bacterium]
MRMLRLLATTCAILLAITSTAQQPAAPHTAELPYVPSLTFDIASIRESPPANSYTVGGPNPAHSGYANLTNYDVMNLLGTAYGVEWAQIVGLPNWTRRALFNIQAKSDSATDDRLAKLTDTQAWSEKQHMFQVLLADRFQLRVHWETRRGQVYNLVVARKGPKLHPAASMPPTPEELKNFGDVKIPPIYQRGNGVRGYEFVAHKCSMALLAQQLTGQMGAPVLDKTGLTATYDFILQYSGATPTDRNDLPGVWPSLITALPDELGLKLESTKGDKKFLIIDHIEKPSPN